MHGLPGDAVLAEPLGSEHVTSLNKLIDVLNRLGVITRKQWCNAHELKWQLMGRPGWVDRNKFLL